MPRLLGNIARGGQSAPRFDARGEVIDFEAKIERLQALLSSHFEGLRAARGDAAIYLLEHGLSSEELDSLLRVLRASLAVRRIESGWWAAHPLPLLVGATEVGYVYRGTGTDFWPIFAERFGDTSLADRTALSGLFQRSAKRFGLAEPADTAWNRAFCHIAWPVLHAILPLELHRSLARALRDVRAHLDVAAGDAELVGPVRNRAHLAGGVRLIAWLDDQRTAAAVIRHFLRPAGQHAIATSALARIAADLARDETANDAMREARKRQKALESEPAPRARRRPAATETRIAPLVLRSVDQRWSLAVKIPQMDQAARESARSALDAIRWRALLWSQGRPVPGRNIFSAFPVPVSVETLPDPDTPLLGEMAALPLSQEAKEFLGSLRVRTSPPLLFSDIAADGDALQMLGESVSDSGRYILLVGADQRPVPSAESLGRVAGLRAFRVDPSQSDASNWLAELGFAVRRAAHFAWLGNPEVEQHRPTRRFRRGSALAFEVAVGEGPCEARLIGPDGARDGIAGQNRIIGAFTPDGPGRYVIEYGGGEKATFEVVDDVDETPLLTVDIDAVTGAISDLADRQATLRFDGAATLQEANVELRLLCDGREAARASGVLPDTPCRLFGSDALWDQLLGTEALERLLGAKSAELRVSVRGLLEASFPFEQTVAPFSWQADDGGKLTACDEVGALSLFASRAQAPLKIETAAETRDGEDVTLFRAGRDGPLQFGGHCVGPSRWSSANAPAIGRPQRLLRQFQGGDAQSADGSSVVDALIAWSAASVDHPVTQYRRGQVVHLLEQWMVEQSCGPVWAQRERSLARNRNKSLGRAFLGACAQLRIGYADVALSPEQRALLDRILLRLMEERALPITLETSQAGIDDDLASGLDELFNEAYETLAERIESVGDVPPYDPAEDVDVGEANDRWEQALRHAASESALIELIDLVRPLGGAESLGLADFESMLPDDVIDLLQAWIARNQPQHLARRWNRDLIEAAYWLFARPAIAARLSWRAAAERLLADRFSARAVRYVALRSSEARAGQ